MTPIAEAVSIGPDTTVTVALVIMLASMIGVLIRHMVKTEHNQEAQSRAIEEMKAAVLALQKTDGDHNLRLTLVERSAPDCHANRTGRFQTIEERDR